MLTKDEARNRFLSALPNGLGDERDIWLESIKEMEFGLVGEAAKKFNTERDGKFLLGVEIGYMMALDEMFGLKGK